MILVDTSVWIDHFRYGESDLEGLLEKGEVVVHPFVIGELALGGLRQRDTILEALNNMPRAEMASIEETLTFINRNGLYGLGIGYIDAHLLASTRLTPATLIWTRDRRLRDAADRLGLPTVRDGGRLASPRP